MGIEDIYHCCVVRVSSSQSMNSGNVVTKRMILVGIQIEILLTWVVAIDPCIYSQLVVCFGLTSLAGSKFMR